MSFNLTKKEQTFKLKFLYFLRNKIEWLIGKLYKYENHLRIECLDELSKIHKKVYKRPHEKAQFVVTKGEIDAVN